MKSLELRDVAIRFGRLRALDGLDLRLDGGTATLLAGPNGAGKSTLIRVLLGLVRPDRGRIVVDGREVPVDRAFKARLGYLPESVAFSEMLSGREVLGFFASARGVPRARIGATLERVGLSAAADRAVRDYSRGMRQRLGLGVAILSEPELLVLDEPTAGLDPDRSQNFVELILTLQRELNFTVIMVTHDIDTLAGLANRVAVLADRRVVAVGSFKEVLAVDHPFVRSYFGGAHAVAALEQAG